MTCYQTNYLHWRSRCCYHCCLPQAYQRSQIWEWIIWQNIHLFTYLLFLIWQTCRRDKKPHPNLKFYNFPGDSKLCVCKTIDSYLERCNVWGLRKDNFLSAILNHINRCLRQQSLGGYGKFLKWLVSTQNFLRRTQLEQHHLQRLK